MKRGNFSSSFSLNLSSLRQSRLFESDINLGRFKYLQSSASPTSKFNRIFDYDYREEINQHLRR
jgi:hypothetical protein